MAKTARWLIFVFGIFFFLAGCELASEMPKRVREMTSTSTPNQVNEDFIILPEPRRTGETSLEETIQRRRSRRDFGDQALTLDRVSQILWAAQGITDEAQGFRAAPSAGALYPLEIYLVIKDQGVEGLEPGVYHYFPEGHRLQVRVKEDIYSEFAQACLGQEAVVQAPASLVVTAEYGRTTGKYGERGKRYVEIEVGHVGQNIYLQAEALELGTCAIGAYNDEEVSRILTLPAERRPLYIMPLGHPK